MRVERIISTLKLASDSELDKYDTSSRKKNLDIFLRIVEYIDKRMLAFNYSFFWRKLVNPLSVLPWRQTLKVNYNHMGQAPGGPWQH